MRYRRFGACPSACVVFTLGVAGAQVAFLSLFQEEVRAVRHLPPPPVLGQVTALGVGQQGKSPVLRVTLVGAGLRRGSVTGVWFEPPGGQPVALEEGRQLAFEATLPRLPLPLAGVVRADMAGGARTLRPLCWLRENFALRAEEAKANAQGDCWGALAADRELAEGLGFDRPVLTGGRAGFVKGNVAGAGGVMVRLDWDKAPDTLSLFVGDPAREGWDFTAWQSVHVTPATGGCAVAPAKPANLAREMKEDALRARCKQDGQGVTVRLNQRLFGGRTPDALTVVPLAHEGGFGEDAAAVDLLPPTRLEMPR